MGFAQKIRFLHKNSKTTGEKMIWFYVQNMVLYNVSLGNLGWYYILTVSIKFKIVNIPCTWCFFSTRMCFTIMLICIFIFIILSIISIIKLFKNSPVPKSNYLSFPFFSSSIRFCCNSNSTRRNNSPPFFVKLYQKSI